MAEKFPTGALAVITFDAQRWADIALGAGELVAFLHPSAPDLTLPGALPTP